MTRLTEIERDIYGHDDRAINRHSERKYKDGAGHLFCTVAHLRRDSTVLRGVLAFYSRARRDLAKT